MRKWTVWTGADPDNNYKGHIIFVHLDEESRLYYFLEWLVEDIIWSLCDFFHKVRLPKLIRNWRRDWGKENYEETFESWYGGDLGCLFHILLCDPSFSFIQRFRNKKASPSIRLHVNEAIKIFENNPDAIKWALKSIEELEAYDREQETNESNNTGHERQEENREISGSQEEGTTEDDCKSGRDTEGTEDSFDN